MSPHTVFILEFVALIGLRLYWHWRADTRRDAETIKAGIAREASFKWIRIGLGIPGAAMMLLYLVAPATLAHFELPFSDNLRWVGAVLFAIALQLLIWVHRSLDRNFNTVLVLRPDHELVMTGPYRWVRHPMYSAFVVLFSGMFLLSASLLFGVLFCVLLSFLLIQRTPREEAQLRERFGAVYDAYHARTGALLPKLK
jgi:protein-S-isoprenylcysteine O-methyltransferase Ste14